MFVRIYSYTKVCIYSSPLLKQGTFYMPNIVILNAGVFLSVVIYLNQRLFNLIVHLLNRTVPQ